jgi:membrane protein
MPLFDLATIKDTYRQFNDDNVPRLAAALSYTTIFALAPLLVVLLPIAGTSIEGRLIGAVQHAAGTQAAKSVRDLVDASFAHRGQSIVAQIVGWVMAVVGAGSVFAALQGSLNTIWHVAPRATTLAKTLRDRLVSFGMLLAIGVVLLLSTALNAALAVVTARFAGLLPFPGAAFVLSGVNAIVAIGVIALLFALMYKYLPDTEVAWRDVWTGAIVTAVLFVAGQSLIAWYLGVAGTASAYGAAGSLLVVLLWLYYSSLIVLAGAEFTRAVAQRRGSVREA